MVCDSIAPEWCRECGNRHRISPTLDYTGDRLSIYWRRRFVRRMSLWRLLHLLSRTCLALLIMLRLDLGILLLMTLIRAFCSSTGFRRRCL